MVANTWIAAAPGDWSDDANWSLGHKPIAGEDPTFDGTSVNNCNANDATPTGVLTIAAGYSGTITQSSDMYITGYSQAGGTFTGVTTKWVYLNGVFTRTAGTITNWKINICVQNGTSATIKYAALFYGFKVYGNLTLDAYGVYCLQNFQVYESGIVNILSSKSMYSNLNLGGNNFILGTINGPGTLIFYNNGADQLYVIEGSVSNNLIVSIVTDSNTGIDKIIKLGNDLTFYKLTVSASFSSNSVFDLNGHSLTATSITVGTRGILQCGEGTIITKALDSSAGTIAEETATWIFERGSTIKVAAAQKLYNVIAKGSSALKLLSNLGISGLFAHPAAIDPNGFTLTLDQPDKEYTGLRRPIIVPVKKLDIGEVGLLDGWLRDLGGLLR